MKQIIIVTILCATALIGLRIVVNRDHSMNVYDVIHDRRSIRLYKDKPIARETMDKILECGMLAPNAMNRQQWELRVVDSREWIDRCTAAFVATIKDTPMADKILTADFKNMFRNATTVVFIAAEPGIYAGVNCGLLGENMILAAQELGLGSCCLGGPIAFIKSEAGEEFYKSLDFSNGYEILYAIGFGYPDEHPDARDRDMSKFKYVD